MKRKPKFHISQVVCFKQLSASRIGRIVDVLRRLGGGWGYLVEVPNAGTSGWDENDLRPLTARERGGKR